MKTTIKKRNRTKLIFFLLLLVLTAQLVTALGIRPAKTTINSEEITSYKGTIWIVNNDHQNRLISIGAGGEFGQYITLSTKELVLREDIDAFPIDFEINLPSEIPPGGATAHLLIEEKKIPDETDNDSGDVGAKISLKHKITIQNGYPDKYIEPKLNFHQSGNNIRLVSEVNNLGKKDINNIKTKFYINNILQNNKEKIETIETEQTSLKTKENKLLEATIPQSVFTPGEFEVEAITTYDDQQIEMTKKLTIGKPEIDITYFDKYFTAHEINKYSLDLLNKWNKEIENVFVDIIVKKENTQIDQFRTKSINLDAKTSKRINDYFDARTKNPGTYSFDMVVNFWDTYHMQTKTYTSELLSSTETPPEEIKSSTEIAANPTSPTGNAIMEQLPANKPFISKEMWYAISGAILASLLFIIYRAGQKKGKDEFEELITRTNFLEKEKIISSENQQNQTTKKESRQTENTERENKEW